MAPQYLRFGAFIPPLHAPAQNPTLALRRDIELVERLDQMGFDEAWFGEHHGIGYEISPSPEIMIAAVAERTRRIRLGTGVISLPFHHPFLVAERMVFLDHLTQGRVMMGVGPGAFPSDAHVMGHDYLSLRRRMPEALDAIVALLESDEPVTRITDWFTLRDGMLNLRPFTRPRFEIVAAASASPSGPVLAGRFGLGLLSLSSTSPEGFAALASAWGIAEEEATESGHVVDRNAWRLVSFYHLADTEEQARRDVRYGIVEFSRYFRQLGRSVSFIPQEMDDPDETIDHLNNTGVAVIGTPDRMVEQLRRLQEQTGGFGAFLGFGHELANREATLASHELMARHVMPWFQGSNERTRAAFEFGTSERWSESFAAAWTKASVDYEQEKQARSGE